VQNNWQRTLCKNIGNESFSFSTLMMSEKNQQKVFVEGYFKLWETKRALRNIVGCQEATRVPVLTDTDPTAIKQTTNWKDWMRDVLKTELHLVPDLAKDGQTHLFIAVYRKMHAMYEENQYRITRQRIAAGVLGINSFVPFVPGTEEELMTNIGDEFQCNAIWDGCSEEDADSGWEILREYYLYGRRLQMLLDTLLYFTLDELMSSKYKLEGLPPISQYYMMDTALCLAITNELEYKIEYELLDPQDLL
jgi:hypothetical protein